ncbi:mediator of DNA damage checkpoint protein 1-like [Thrips palmi]|uniref:Mediator of DNA damage checkpoint protein 1-like n=1 Tax=Thrips palmi TaxID=161013 RepID=A0A6P8YCF6_THRPL|nr:mediator of DNA damage checkpoint protein 1-like [Thrips palmi]
MDLNKLCKMNLNQSAVPVKDEPCLRCRCRRGAPVCRLRVCAPLPDPPPPGCVLLHRAHACCPELHCPEIGVVDNRLEARHGQSTRYRSDAPNKEFIAVPRVREREHLSCAAGCYLNGSLFAEGSALSSSTLCDYCYCVRGQQRCVRPQCVLPAPGCTPEYRDHTCCPTSYQCGATASNASSSTPPPRRPAGCTVDGKRYRDGAQVKSVARGRCETCFCMRGRVRCAPLKCDLPLDGCEPVTAPGRCCPVSYDCSKSRVSITKTVTAATGYKTKGSIGRPSNGENSVRSISFDARSNREISTKDTGKVKNEMEGSEQNVVLTTQPPLPDESPTTLMTGIADNIAITLNTKLDLGDNLDLLKIKNNTVFPEKNKILPVIEAIINKTRQKDQDYDYDYNEPSLPPSLPNLRIIPFVAADAVVQEEKTSSDGGQILPESSNVASSKESQDKIDNFYFFSPPTETEGGFVPREPVIDGPFYQHKPDAPKKEAGQKVTPVKAQTPEVTIRTVVPDAVTPDPLLGNGGSAACTSGGRRYRHGELLTGMGACRMCFCFDGGVVCQEPSCGVVPPGCSRSPSRDPERCCGSITCEGEETRDRPLLFADVPDNVPDNEPHRVHSKVPERPPGIEPVSDLVPGSTTPQPTKRPLPSKTTTTTSTTAAPTTTTTTVASSTTKGQRRKTTTSTTTSAPAAKSTAKPALKTKSTTPKPGWTTKKPAASTTKATVPSSTKSTVTTSTTSTEAPATTRPTTPRTTTTTPKATTTSPKTTTTTKATPPVSTQKPAGPAPNATTTQAPSSTPRTEVTLASTSSSVATTRAPVRKERPTTTPTSLFDALWGSEDESENEAQDKVDEDVQYHDFVSTNEHEAAPAAPKPPEEAEEDSFSFDKFLELFMQPDTTTLPTPQRTAPPVVTTRRPPSSTKPTPTILKTSAATSPTSTNAPPTTTPSTTTAASPATTAASTTKPTTARSPPSTSKPSTTSTTTPATPKQSSTAKPVPPPAKVNATSTTPASVRTTQKDTKPPTTKPPAAPAKKAPTTPKPKPSPTAKPVTTSKPPTTKPSVTKASTTTARPTSTTTKRASTTARTTTPSTTMSSTLSTPTSSTSTTTTTTSTTTTPAPLATMRPSLLFGGTKFRPSFLQDALAALGGGGGSSSYPAQQHHMTAPGLSGLLKLAGCNIYGRMYRVGKIIQELSGPCLECRCTEVGVQCQQLGC